MILQHKTLLCIFLFHSRDIRSQTLQGILHSSLLLRLPFSALKHFKSSWRELHPWSWNRSSGGSLSTKPSDSYLHNNYSSSNLHPKYILSMPSSNPCIHGKSFWSCNYWHSSTHKCSGQKVVRILVATIELTCLSSSVTGSSVDSFPVMILIDSLIVLDAASQGLKSCFELDRWMFSFLVDDSFL